MSFDKLKELWSSLSGRQRFQIVASAAGTLLLIWVMVQQAQKVRYATLFTGLGREDSNAIISHLKSEAIPYRLEAGGEVIEVPLEHVDELRLELAAEGRTMGGVGFEIFDRNGIGDTSTLMDIKYQRALERELARTIESLDSIRQARVHLALPEDTPFLTEDIRPSASVAVALLPGRTVERERVRAIINLVASGVRGLAPNDVAVVDMTGRVLSDPSDGEDGGLTVAQLDTKRSMERRIENTLVDLLEPVVGPGKVRVRATVDLNLRRVDRIEESFDPNGAVVRSEQKSKSKGSQGGAAGAPGAAANIAGGGGGNGSGNASETSSTVTNFEINKTVSTIREPVGSLSRQSIGVVLDHAMTETTADDGTVTREAQPRSPDELQRIEELIKAAIGFDDGREDTLTVTNFPFAPVEEPVAQGTDWMALLPTVLRFATLPLAVLLLALLVVRPAIGALKSASAPAPALPEGGAADRLPGVPTVAELEASLAGGAPSPTELLQMGPVVSPLQQKLIEAIRQDPSAAALVLRSWIDEDSDA